MTSPLVVDPKGNELLECVRGSEADLDRLDANIPLPLALVVARHRGETLLMSNGSRQVCELPGMLDPGETPRRFVEATGQLAPAVTFTGRLRGFP